MDRTERRNLRERALLVQSIINNVLENPSITLSIRTLQVGLNLSLEAAERILERLRSAGLVRQIDRGVFVRAAVPGVYPWR